MRDEKSKGHILRSAYVNSAGEHFPFPLSKSQSLVIKAARIFAVKTRRIPKFFAVFEKHVGYYLYVVSKLHVMAVKVQFNAFLNSTSLRT